MADEEERKGEYEVGMILAACWLILILAVAVALVAQAFQGCKAV